MPVAILKSDALKGVWNRARYSAVLYGALATSVRAGANLILLPLVLKSLAPPELALWYVFLALGGIANLAEFGFGSAITRVYSYLWAGAEDFRTEGLGPPTQDQSPNRAGVAQFHSGVRTIYVRIALLATGLLIVIGTVCLIRPVAAAANPTASWLCWAAFILSVTFSLASNYWMLACHGINRMRELQAAHLVSGLAYVLSAAVLLILGWGLFAMVAATAVRAAIGREMCRRAYLTAMPEPATADHAHVKSILTRLWPNARKFGLISLGGYLTAQANVLVSSQVLGAEATASFGLSSQVAAFIVNFSALWLTVKWAQITMLRAQGRAQEMAVLFARRLALVMGTFALMAILLILFGNRILEWKGTQTRFLPAAYLSVYLFYMFQQQFYVQFGSLAYTENEVPFFKLSIFSGIGVTLSSFMLARYFGLWGLIVAPLIVTVTSCAWYVTWRGFRGQPLTMPQFARAAVLGRL